MKWEILCDFEKIPQKSWEECSRNHPSPLSDWKFWKALFDSESLSPQGGWESVFFLGTKENKIQIISPWFVRSHSYGDFVFDQGLAAGVEGAGLPYYPKLLAMAPFTPSTFFPFFLADHRDKELLPDLLEFIQNWGLSQGISTFQVSFQKPSQGKLFLDQGYVPWAHQEYRWFNKEYESFEDFLGTLKKGYRKNIRQERKYLEQQGLQFKVLHQNEVPGWGQKMQSFYQKTNAQFGPYAARFLSKDFFTHYENLDPENIFLSLAYTSTSKDPLAMAFLIRKKNFVAGRYWGTDIQTKHLHFEVCYYQVQQWCIENGIQEFDPGMGSSHKVARGFESQLGWSLHRFHQAGLQEAFLSHARQWSKMASEHVQTLNLSLPYKNLK